MGILRTGILPVVRLVVSWLLFVFQLFKLVGFSVMSLGKQYKFSLIECCFVDRINILTGTPQQKTEEYENNLLRNLSAVRDDLYSSLERIENQGLEYEDSDLAALAWDMLSAERFLQETRSYVIETDEVELKNIYSELEDLDTDAKSILSETIYEENHELESFPDYLTEIAETS